MWVEWLLILDKAKLVHNVFQGANITTQIWHIFKPKRIVWLLKKLYLKGILEFPYYYYYYKSPDTEAHLVSSVKDSGDPQKNGGVAFGDGLGMIPKQTGPVEMDRVLLQGGYLAHPHHTIPIQTNPF